MIQPATRLSAYRWQIPLILGVLVALNGAAIFAQETRAQETPQSAPVIYTVSLAKASMHLVDVQIDLPPGAAERDLQLPVWYALYQVRDFSQYINWVRIAGAPAATIRMLDKSRWHISGAETGAKIYYEVFSNDPEPYGAQLNLHHAFFNLAEILMYPVDARSLPMQVHFTDIPAAWRVATELPAENNLVSANNYDELADSPVEISAFDERDFDEGGGHFRVIVDAEDGDYDMNKLVSMIDRIVIAEIKWMNDRPFSAYTFIYHFPRGGGGGGMEHANGTAIDISPDDFADFAGVTAHEFFHLWNVKRIRPQSLEPPDYTKENYTDALWFSEGFTSAVENYALLRAGLLDERGYISHLQAAITELENRPAHLTQSAEESSNDAWLEKYSYYRRPERSVSYYNEGELLGVILDLKLRDSSNGTKSLRDLFQWMNLNYAKKNECFPDSEGVRKAAENVSHADLRSFFDQYIRGAAEIPWNEFFGTVGLRIETEKIETADVGFEAVRNFDSMPAVVSIDEDSPALRAGLQYGDLILTVNGQTPGRNFEQLFRQLHPGDAIRLRIRNGNGERELTWKAGRRDETQYQLKDQANITSQQKARRAAWLKGESQAGDSKAQVSYGEPRP